MREIKRLAAAAELQNNADGYLTLNVQDFDGGLFGLHPRATSDAVILADRHSPRYALAITGDPEALGRLGRALLTIERNAKNGDDAGDEASE